MRPFTEKLSARASILARRAPICRGLVLGKCFPTVRVHKALAATRRNAAVPHSVRPVRWSPAPPANPTFASCPRVCSASLASAQVRPKSAEIGQTTRRTNENIGLTWKTRALLGRLGPDRPMFALLGPIGAKSNISATCEQCFSDLWTTAELAGIVWGSLSGLEASTCSTTFG